MVGWVRVVKIHAGLRKEGGGGWMDGWMERGMMQVKGMRGWKGGMDGWMDDGRMMNGLID